MSNTTASIAKRGCNATGITDELVERLHNQRGHHFMAVVELFVAETTDSAEGKDKVGLKIVSIEPAPNQATDDHLRNLARSFYYERKLVEDGPQLPQEGVSPEPTVKDVLAAGDQYIPHAFQDGAEDPDICNLCGGREVARVHHHDDAPDNEADTEEPDEDAKVLEFSGKP